VELNAFSQAFVPLINLGSIRGSWINIPASTFITVDPTESTAVHSATLLLFFY